MKGLLIFVVGVLLTSCGSKKAGNTNGGSNGGPTVPLPTVSIATDLEDITAANAAHFMLSGTCSENGQPITVSVEDLSPETAPTCTDGSWMAEIDLTPLTGPSREVSITADHASSGGQNATQATGSALLHPRVFIATDLANITATNAANFMLSGTCSEEGQSITVSVEDLSPETAPTCTNGAWMAEIDLTPLTGPSREVSITADHSIDNLNAPQATGTVFLSPRVSIASQLLEDITSFNASTFSVSGTCSEEGEDITVSVGTINATTACTTGGTWVAEIDLSSLTGDSVTTAITVDHATSSGLSALQATASVTLNPPVSINTVALTNITAANAASFAVSGDCSDNGQPVTVRVGGVSPATDPNCTTGAWSITVDVTGLNKMAEVSITVDHSPASGSPHPQATTSVTNDFVCPANYVGVPALSTYTTNSFCVMKYEAKSDGSASNNAISQASGTPYASINRADSISKCTGLNSAGEDKHDLITNDEWQSIARNLELVGDNWSTGVVGNAGGLSRGHSDSSPSNALAAMSDDTKGCEGTGQTCSNTVWDSQRRTHTLSNGEVIWDIAGNVWEWVKDHNDSTYNSSAYFSEVTATSHSTSNSLSGGTTTTARNAKAQFGPSGDYTSLSTSPWGNLGYGWFASAGGVFRGGHWGYAGAGVFATNLNSAPMASYTNLGFRCVLHP